MYCENCGAELKEGVKKCLICGSTVYPLEYPDDDFEEEAEDEIKKEPVSLDQPDRETETYKEELSSAANKVSDMSKKLTGKAVDYLNSGSKKVEASVKRQQERQKAEVESRKKARENNELNRAYMSETEMWTWLKRDSKQKMYYTPKAENDPLHNEMTEDQFITELQEKMDQNNVPAVMKGRKITWDRSGIEQVLYIAEINSETVNPLTHYVSFHHVGDFTFVEEKTFIKPPALPDVPLKPLTANFEWKTDLRNGVVLFVVGYLMFSYLSKFLGIVLIAGGLFFLARVARNYAEVVSVKNHNLRCAEMKIAWEAAWENWKQTIFTYAFQEDINGEVGRIYDAVSACVEQICNDLFKEHRFREQSESANMNDLEQMMQRRMEEYR